MAAKRFVHRAFLSLPEQDERAASVRAFLNDLASVCKAHGMHLEHEDGQGAFEVHSGSESSDIQWMMDAHDATNEEVS